MVHRTHIIPVSGIVEMSDNYALYDAHFMCSDSSLFFTLPIMPEW